jgi:hypothetical protein
MRGFFKGWKRKLGVVTLGLACLFAAGWVRSLSVRDATRFTVTARQNAISSAEGHISWVAWNANVFRNSDALWISRALVRGKWAWTCFDTDDFEGVAGRVALAIPYFAIVIPLSLLSAWLVLSKPKPKHKTAVPDIASNQGFCPEGGQQRC